MYFAYDFAVIRRRLLQSCRHSQKLGGTLKVPPFAPVWKGLSAPALERKKEVIVQWVQVLAGVAASIRSQRMRTE